MALVAVCAGVLAVVSCQRDAAARRLRELYYYHVTEAARWRQNALDHAEFGRTREESPHMKQLWDEQTKLMLQEASYHAAEARRLSP
jgi:hypothetical protein